MFLIWNSRFAYQHCEKFCRKELLHIRKFNFSKLSYGKESTFKERIIFFLKTSEKYSEVFSPKTIYLQQKSSLRVSVNDLVLKLTLPCNANKVKKLSCENELHEQLLVDMCGILDHCTGKEALIVFNILFNIGGENVKKGIFYQLLLQKAKYWINSCSTHQELVFWAFVCSLDRSQKSNIFCLRLIYERFKTNHSEFESLTHFETSILCNLWFTNGINVSSKRLLRTIESVLRKEIDSFPGVITQESLSLIKLLRKSTFSTDQLIDSLASSLSSSSAHNLNLAQTAHT